jgi:hypothetical protein
MAAAGKAGTYNSWMFEESDLIQLAAKVTHKYNFHK